MTSTRPHLTIDHYLDKRLVHVTITATEDGGPEHMRVALSRRDAGPWYVQGITLGDEAGYEYRRPYGGGLAPNPVWPADVPTWAVDYAELIREELP